MANTITFFRIAASIVLLFCPVFSPAFYVFYIVAGVSAGWIRSEKNKYGQQVWGKAGYDCGLCACGRMPDQTASDP